MLDPECDTIPRVLKGWWCGSYNVHMVGSVWQNWNGNRNVAYLDNWNGKRNLNLNWIDNDWNRYCRFLAVRKSLYSPAPREFLFFVALSRRQSFFQPR